MLATASKKGGALQLLLLRRNGTVYNRHTLGDGKCTWLEWDSQGQVTGVRRPTSPDLALSAPDLALGSPELA